MGRAIILRVATVLGLVLAGSSVAAGQTPAPAPGPFVLTPIPNDIVFSPDVKVTSVDGQTSTLVGAYVGRLSDGRLFLGGAGYWLAGQRQNARLMYVGALTGWRIAGGRRFALDGRLFAGVGQGAAFRVIRTVAHADFTPADEAHVWTSDALWVAEPQITGQLSIGDVLQIVAGIGYRATSDARFGRSVFSGATGSIGVQFDLGN